MYRYYIHYYYRRKIGRFGPTLFEIVKPRQFGQDVVIEIHTYFTVGVSEILRFSKPIKVGSQTAEKNFR